MSDLHCLWCGLPTPKNYADESKYQGVCCKKCATEKGFAPRPPVYTPPPSTRRSAPSAPCPENAWDVNLGSLQAGALGDPKDPETLLRYWVAQEAAGYPGAKENTMYFQGLIDRSKSAPAPGDKREARWLKARSFIYCSMCKDEPYGNIRSKYCPFCGAKMRNYMGDEEQ